MPSNTYFSAIRYTADNHLIAGGGRLPTSTTSQGLVVKYSAAGTIVAQRLLTNGAHNVIVDSVRVLPSGDILIAINDDTGDTVMTLDPTLQTILWSRNIGIVGRIQSLLVAGNTVYINSRDLIAKVTIGGDVVWVTTKAQSYSNMCINPVDGNLVVVSSQPFGSPVLTARTMWVYTLSATTGEFLMGNSIAFDAVTTNPLIGVVGIVPASSGFTILTSNTMVVRLGADLTTITWATQISAGFEGFALREAAGDLYIGGRDMTQHVLTAAKISSTGTITWQKSFAEPSNTLNCWWSDGQDMMDVTPTRVAVCGHTANITAPVFTNSQSVNQAAVLSFVNNSTFTYNTISDPTHVIDAVYTTTPITSTTTVTPTTAELLGIVIVAAA